MDEHFWISRCRLFSLGDTLHWAVSRTEATADTFLWNNLVFHEVLFEAAVFAPERVVVANERAAYDIVGVAAENADA